MLMTRICTAVKKKNPMIKWLQLKSFSSNNFHLLTKASIPENQNHQIFAYGNLTSTLYPYILFHESKYYGIFMVPKFCVKNCLMIEHNIIFKKRKQTHARFLLNLQDSDTPWKGEHPHFRKAPLKILMRSYHSSFLLPDLCHLSLYIFPLLLQHLKNCQMHFSNSDINF